MPDDTLVSTDAEFESLLLFVASQLRPYEGSGSITYQEDGQWYQLTISKMAAIPPTNKKNRIGDAK